MSAGAYLPPAAILLPVRGMDVGFEENVRAILSQDYPEYRLIVVVDDPQEPALLRARALASQYPRIPVAEALADPSGLGGKANALRSALAHLSPDDEVVVFADADIRPARDWLRELVQPLADITVGAATGFRWYTPPQATFWSLVRAEWNGVSANVLFDPSRVFVWGGSSAVRVEHLPALRLEEHWRNVLSDDLVLARAVREAGLQIRYAPRALVATAEGADRALCKDWCERQMIMATLYLPIVRRYAERAFAVFNGSVILGLLSIVLVGLVSLSFLVPAFLFLVTLPATVAKAALRRRALFMGAPAVGSRWRVPAWRSALASLVVPWVMMVALLRTRRPTFVRWRGRVYDVRNPGRVQITRSEDAPRS